MKVTSLEIPDLKLIEPKVFGDPRGFFVERFNAEQFQSAGLPTHFVQDNHSRSAYGVIRGLHYQRNPDQGKLVGVVRGRIFDVAVDLRANSPTYLKWAGVELDGDSGRMLWIPPGFAHGFSVISEGLTDVIYKVTGIYNAAGEGGIRYDDPDLKIDWRVSSPTISKRDEVLGSVAEYRAKPLW